MLHFQWLNLSGEKNPMDYYAQYTYQRKDIILIYSSSYITTKWSNQLLHIHSFLLDKNTQLIYLASTLCLVIGLSSNVFSLFFIMTLFCNTFKNATLSKLYSWLSWKHAVSAVHWTEKVVLVQEHRQCRDKMPPGQESLGWAIWLSMSLLYSPSQSRNDKNTCSSGNNLVSWSSVGKLNILLLENS